VLGAQAALQAANNERPGLFSLKPVM